MPREENLLILKMIQDGTITAEQAAELLSAIDASDARAAIPAAPPTPSVSAAAPIPPFPPVPPIPPIPPTPPLPTLPPEMMDAQGEAFARAREKIAAARERVAGVQEQLSAAEERLGKAESAPNPWESVADALKDVPGARSISEALRGVDPGRIASNAQRQARRLSRQFRSSLGDMNFDLNINFAEAMQGEATLSVPREATTLVPSGGTLRVRNTLGDIQAQGADVPEVRVAGVLEIWAADEAAAQLIADQIVLTVEQGADGPTVSVQHPPKLRRVQLDLKVFVPQEGTKVSLLSLSGDVTARGLKNSVVLATQSGDAKASEIVGDVAAETTSGDIAFEGVIGNISASTTSGDVQAIRLSGQSFRANTKSGDVDLAESTVSVVNLETMSGDANVKNTTGRTLRIRAISGDGSGENVAFDGETHLDSVSGYLSFSPQGPLTAGTIALVTVSGDAELKLPTVTNATLSLSTVSGEASAVFLGTDNAEKKVSASGRAAINETIGSGGGVQITLSTVSGDLSVTQDSPIVEIS